jgi:hypothetical protein
MGQPITVVRKPTPKPGVIRFDANRSLTGMGHERYRSAADATGHRPPDVLARRLFEHAQVASVHVYSNIITVELASGADADALAPEIESLFIHYTEGVTPSVT